MLTRARDKIMRIIKNCHTQRTRQSTANKHQSQNYIEYPVQGAHQTDNKRLLRHIEQKFY